MDEDEPGAADRPRTQRTRRGVLRSAAALGGAAALAGLVSACRDGGTGAEGGGQSVRGSVEAAQVPVGGGVVLAEPPVVVTQPTAGEFHAFSAICTHQGCPVSRVERGGILCPCHSSFFDPATGGVLGGPAPEPLPELQVTVEGGTVVFSSS